MGIYTALEMVCRNMGGLTAPAVAVIMALASLAPAEAKAAFPFKYNWTKFPAAWFGANATNWESPDQIAEIGKYSMAILGWQHLTKETHFTDVVYAQLAQAAVIKAAYPEMPVYVYTSFGWAFGMNAAVYPIMNDPAYEDFFLRSGDGYEFSYTNCQQTGTTPA